MAVPCWRSDNIPSRSESIISARQEPFPCPRKSKSDRTATGRSFRVAQTSNTVGTELDIGTVAGSLGSYTITGYGSTLTVNGGLYVGGASFGAGGSGTLTIGAGSTVFAGTLQIYPGAANSVTLNGGTIIVNSFVSASPSQFLWNSGSINFLDGLIIDSNNIAHFDGSSSISLQAGQAIVVSNADEVVGFAGSGSITQSGGTNYVVNANLDIGFLGNGTYNLSGGALIQQTSLDSEYIGHFGTGTLTQSGGTNEAVNFFLGSNSGGMGTIRA